MSRKGRSGCPLTLALEVVGDRWSLLIVRELLFHGPMSFAELQDWPAERMSSKVLAARLRHLQRADLVARWVHVEPTKRHRYSLTRAGIDLMPAVAELGAWGCRHTRAAPEASARWLRLEQRDPAFRTALMREMEAVHLRPAHWRRFASPQMPPLPRPIWHELD
jgi:DNA-binding HxlR family transcriptional regulator